MRRVYFGCLCRRHKQEFVESEYGRQFPQETDTNLMDEVILEKERKTAVAKVLSGLLPKEENLIRMRFGLGFNPPCTLENIAFVEDRNRETIRVREAKILRKLRHPSRSMQLKELL